MLNANVKGVAFATNKDDLILLMCKFNCMCRMSQDLPEIYPAPKPAAATATVSNEDVLKFVQRNQVAAHTSDTSSSAATQPEIQTQKGINPAAAAAASKRFWAAAQTARQPAAQTAKVPNHVSKKSAAASLFCTCSGAELRSEKCSFCLQFLLE